MRPVAQAHGVSVARIAIAWLLHQKVVTSVIVGAKRIEQLEDNLAACDVALTTEQLKALDEASALPPEYPGWMTAFQGQGRGEMLAQRRQGGSTQSFLASVHADLVDASAEPSSR